MDLQLIAIACLAGPQVVFTSNNDSNIIFVMIVMQLLSLTGSAVNNDRLLTTSLFDCVLNEAMQMLTVSAHNEKRARP